MLLVGINGPRTIQYVPNCTTLYSLPQFQNISFQTSGLSLTKLVVFSSPNWATGVARLWWKKEPTSVDSPNIQLPSCSEASLKIVVLCGGSVWQCLASSGAQSATFCTGKLTLEREFPIGPFIWWKRLVCEVVTWWQFYWTFCWEEIKWLLEEDCTAVRVTTENKPTAKLDVHS